MSRQAIPAIPLDRPVPLEVIVTNPNLDGTPYVWHRDKPGERPLVARVRLPAAITARMKGDWAVALTTSIRCARLIKKDDHMSDMDLAKVCRHLFFQLGLVSCCRLSSACGATMPAW